MRRTVAFSVLALAAAAAPAFAQPSAAPGFTTSQAPGAVIAEPPPPSDSGVAGTVNIPQPDAAAAQIPTAAQSYIAADPAAGRAFLSPTAFTARKGTAGVELWAPAVPVGILAAGTYAITDRIEIAGGGMGVFVDEGATAGYLSAKVQVIRRAGFGVAAQLQYISAPDSSDDSLTLLTGAASKCLGAGCKTLVTLHLSATPGVDQSDALHILAGGSLVTGTRLKVVLDAYTFGEGPDHGGALYAGLRRVRHAYALDAGFVAYSDGDDAGVLPLPLVALNYRF